MLLASTHMNMGRRMVVRMNDNIESILSPIQDCYHAIPAY